MLLPRLQLRLLFVAAFIWTVLPRINCRNSSCNGRVSVGLHDQKCWLDATRRPCRKLLRHFLRRCQLY